MSSVLSLVPEEVDTIEKRGKFTVCVIGCREGGILYAVAFAGAGFRVICTDADQSLIRRLARGRTPNFEREIEVKLKNFVRTERLSTTSEIKNSVSQSDIVIITIPARIDTKRNPDYSEVENSCRQIGAALHRGTLVIYGGITSFGFIESVIKETLENASGLRVGEDFGLAYNPLHIPSVQALEISNQELIVAANDKTSLGAASIVLGSIAKKGIKQILSIKTAELAALFTVARRDANVALANELAILCENAGIDYYETINLSVPDTQRSFSPTIAAERDKNEAYILLENAESLNTKLRLMSLSRQINESMVKHVVTLIQHVLRSCGKTLRRARVAVLGAVRLNTAAEMLVKLLEAKGAKVSVYDPVFAKSSFSEVARVFKRSLNEAVEFTDCLVLLAEKEQYERLNLKKLRNIMKMPAAIVDLTGKLDLQKVEKAGFTYRGLGRGAET